MKTKSIRILSAFLSLVMVLGVMVVMPMTASAYSNSDGDVKNKKITGSTLPDGAEVYDGVPSTSLEGTGTEEDPFLIYDAADFMYFRNEFLASRSTTTVVSTTYKNPHQLTTVVTNAESGEEISSTTGTVQKKNVYPAEVVCVTGDYVGVDYHYKLMGDIYLNSATYGEKNSVHNELREKTYTIDTVAFVTDENGYTAAVYDKEDEEISASISTSTTKDGETTTVICSNGSLSVHETHNFYGVLDGNGHTIYNMYGYGSSDISLFYEIYGTIKNLNFDGVRLRGASVAVLAKHMARGSVVENVHFNNVHLSATNNIGGFVTTIVDDTLFKNCSISGSVSSSNKYVGGIVGYYSDSSKAAPAIFENCINNATVTGTHNNSRVGGILGADDTGANSYGVRFIDCVNNGEVHGEKSSGVAAGMVGNLYRPNGIADYINCINNGKIVGRTAGGLIGTYSPGSSANAHVVMTNCVNNGEVVGQVNAGGFGGEMAPITGVTMTDCFNYGNISASDATSGYAGGFFGTTRAYNPAFMSFYLIVNNGANYGNVASAFTAGGVVGRFLHSSSGSKINLTGFISDCDVSADVYASAVVGVYDVYQNASMLDKSFVLTNTWIRGSVTTTTGNIAVFSAGAPNNAYVITNTNKTDYYTPIDFDPIVKPVLSNSGLDVTFYANGAEVAASDIKSVNYHLISDRYDSTISYNSKDATNNLDAFLTLFDMHSATGYNDGTQDVDAAYPTVASSAFTNGTVQSTLNTYASANSYTPWAQGAKSPVPVTTIGFSGATMSLGENMQLNLKLNGNAFTALAGKGGKVSVTFVRNGEATPGNASVVDARGYYTAAFACDAADLAKSAEYYIEVDINGTAYTSTNILTYAPIEYATALYKDANTTEVTENVVIEMLSMAAVSEMLKYGTQTPEIATIATTAGVPLRTAETLVIPTDMEYYALNATDAAAAIGIINQYVETGADLNGNVNLVFNVTNADVAGLKVSFSKGGKDYATTYEAVKDGQITQITVSGLNAGGIKDLLKLEFLGADGIVLQTVNFSVGNYLQTVILYGKDVNQKALATAMVLYMMSVKEYAGA